jgi:hypothetical protein
MSGTPTQPRPDLPAALRAAALSVAALPAYQPISRPLSDPAGRR